MSVPVIDLNDSRLQADRPAFLEELRAQNWYARTTTGAVAFFNQEDVMEVFRCENYRFTFPEIDEARSPYLAKAIRHELLNMHGDQHARLSRLLKQALRDRIIEGMAAAVDKIVAALIDDFPGQGEIEFCADFADPLPGRVLGPMFGLPYDQVDGLNDWIRVGGRKLDALQSGAGIDEVEEANRNIHTYLRDLLAARRGAAGDDFFSELMRAEIDGDRMSAEELVYLAGELASAGVDTTRTQLPLILLTLLDHPDEMAKLVAEPRLALRAVDEGMRFAPLPWVIPHAATTAHTYRGVDFAEGDLVFAVVPAANRDPAAMAAPQRFDITRDRARNFSFGYGMHACPAAQLARMEMSAALRQLVTRLDTISLASEPDWHEGQVDRSLATLRLVIRKSA